MTVSLTLLLITACNYARLACLLPTPSLEHTTKPKDFLPSAPRQSQYEFLWSSSLMVEMGDRLGVVTK